MKHHTELTDLRNEHGQAVSPQNLDLYVTRPSGMTSGRSFGAICEIHADRSTRLVVYRAGHDSADPRETWDLPPETTVADLMDRLARALTAG